MKLYSIPTGFFKLDGGAMFGVVPKQIWNKLNPADELNLCTWAMRCLMIEVDNKLILIDNGIGEKQSEKFFSFYHLHGEDSLTKSLNKYGFHPNDITDNILSHLHFDHAGGGVKWNNDRTKYELTFPNATYWTAENHWLAATHPNKREKASFLTENLLPMQESGHLKTIENENLYTEWLSFEYSDGHTDAMIIPKIVYKNKTICFVADLFPSSLHIPVNYNMGYDIRPLTIMQEKEKFLAEAVEKEYILFFEHDPIQECCTITRTEKGFAPKEFFKISDL